jgi:hypothetical protein
VHDARAAVQGLGRIIGAQVDLERVRALARQRRAMARSH